MKKDNFTNEQVGAILKALSSKLIVRVNKAGNIDVVNPNRTNKEEHFVLYLDPNKRYLWRRHFGWGYCYPLNMKNRNQMDKREYTYYDGTKTTYETYSFAKHATFGTVDEAIEYFVKYIKKYHNVKL